MQPTMPLEDAWFTTLDETCRALWNLVAGDLVAATEVVHLSFHGGVDWAEPARSGLLMAHDEVLTVEDLFALRLNGARLASLSACESGVPAHKVPDESVSLPSALLLAGFGGVVGSLWSVDDVSTAMLMARFYELWREAGKRPAEALRDAKRWLRDTTNGEKAAYYDRQIRKRGGVHTPSKVAEAFQVSLWPRARSRGVDPTLPWARIVAARG